MRNFVPAHRFVTLTFVFASIAVVFAVFAYSNRVAAAPDVNLSESAHLVVPQGHVSRECIIKGIFVTDNRWHIECTTAQPAEVYFYAIEHDTAHKIQADRMLVLVNTAAVLNKPITLLYESLTTLNPVECDASNCRRLVGVNFNP